MKEKTRTQRLVAAARLVKARLGEMPTGAPPPDLLARKAGAMGAPLPKQTPAAPPPLPRLSSASTERPEVPSAQDSEAARAARLERYSMDAKFKAAYPSASKMLAELAAAMRRSRN